MNIFLLYVILLKATATSFAGLAALPAVHDALITHYHVLTEQQLNEAIVITRSTPGAVGLFIVSVGYFVSGWPGALAGWLAMITPALTIIPILHYAGRRVEHPRVKTVLQSVVIASAALLFAAAIPLGRDALTDPLTITIATISLALLLMTKIETFWILLGGASVTLIASAIGAISKIS